MSCDPEIFRDGKYLLCLMEYGIDMSVADLNAICENLTAVGAPRARFDWHYQGGRPMVLYVGDYQAAKEAYFASASVMQAISTKYIDCYVKAGLIIKTATSKLGTPGGPPLSAPNMVTVGQVLNHTTSQ